VKLRKKHLVKYTFRQLTEDSRIDVGFVLNVRLIALNVVLIRAAANRYKPALFCYLLCPNCYH